MISYPADPLDSKPELSSTKSSLPVSSRLLDYSFEAGYSFDVQFQTKYLSNKGKVNLNIDYSLSKNFSLSAGVGLSGIILSGIKIDARNDSITIDVVQGDSVFFLPDSSIVENKFSGSFLLFEIPFMLNYKKTLNDNYSLYVTTGLSNRFFIKENYTSETLPETEFASSPSWLLLYKLSFSIEKVFNEKISLKLSPALNVPLNGQAFETYSNNSFEIRLFCSIKL